VFISDLVLQILAYVAETERTFIKQWQAEGIIAAKNRGLSLDAVKVKCQRSLKNIIRCGVNIRKANISQQLAFLC
jgi:DNA invertase Pin-like site-specific DNA recombinase